LVKELIKKCHEPVLGGRLQAAVGERGRPARGLSEALSLCRGEPLLKSAGEGGSKQGAALLAFEQVR
jgi:hypothetical protein